MLIGFEKDFDSISCDFIFQTLDLFNFGYSIIDWLKTFYSGNTERNNLRLFFHKEAAGKVIRFYHTFFFYMQRF